MTEIELLNTLRFKKMKNVFFKMMDVPYAVIKGDVLSILAYGKEGERVYNDIDILIEKENVDLLINILKEEGFFCKPVTMKKRVLLSFSHQTETFYCDFMGIRVIVDVNTSIYWGEYEGNRISMSDFLSETENMTCYGVTFKTLSPIKLFVQLCLHSYKDYNSIYLLWERNILNKQCLQDIYNIVCVKKQIDINELKLVAKECYSEKYVCVMLIYTYSYYMDEKLLPYIKSVMCDDVIELIKKYGLSHNEKKYWKCSIVKRLLADNIREIIVDQLNDRDYMKIKINKDIF